MRASKQQLQALREGDDSAAMQQLQMRMLQWKAEQEYSLQQQLTQQQQAHFEAMREQMHLSHLDADDLRELLQQIKPGEKISVKRYEGFEIDYQQKTDPGKVIVLLILIVGFVGCFILLGQ